jgi:hypothetical protein
MLCFPSVLPPSFAPFNLLSSPTRFFRLAVHASVLTLYYVLHSEYRTWVSKYYYRARSRIEARCFDLAYFGSGFVIHRDVTDILT